MRARQLTLLDRLLAEADTVLRTLNNRGQPASRPSPAEGHRDGSFSDSERRHIAGLMRVNHTGEVCAQALYQGQALTAKLPDVREEMVRPLLPAGRRCRCHRRQVEPGLCRRHRGAGVPAPQGPPQAAAR
jgi:hypothetical protein